MEFTGERAIPGHVDCPEDVIDEHLERYNFAANYSKDKKILDIACGVGYGSKIFFNKGAAKVDGIDISNEAVEFAEKNYGNEKTKFSCQDAETFISNNPYDFIVSFETIEHLDNPNIFVKNLANNINKGGLLIISTPNSKCRQVTHSNVFHKQEFGEVRLKKLLIENDFLVKNILCQGFAGTDLFSKVIRKLQKFNILPKIIYIPKILRKNNPS